MNIINPIRECLEKGEIRIGSYYGLICVVLKNNNTILARVQSQKGVRHAFLMLIAQAIESKTLELLAEDLYRYPLGPSTTTELDDFALGGRYIRIYLQGNVIRVDAHQTSMPCCDSIPDLYYKRGWDKWFGRAIKKMLKAEPTAELPVTNPM